LLPTLVGNPSRHQPNLCRWWNYEGRDFNDWAIILAEGIAKRAFIVRTWSLKLGSKAVVSLSVVLFLQSCLMQLALSCEETQEDPKVSAVHHRRHHHHHLRHHTGKAHIYSDKYIGKRTASGEPYNPHEHTAASPHLPLGTLVEVTHAHTGKSLTVRINDRSADVGNVVIDLSKSAAKHLGVNDVAPVTLKLVSKDTGI
jgi:rare lipoprotein A